MMPSAPLSHPDRLATTLANLPDVRAERSPASGNPPAAGAADCRIDLKLMQWLAQEAAKRSPAARTHLAAFPPEDYAQLWAGTVRDGVARGFCVHLEEAISLAPELGTASAEMASTNSAVPNSALPNPAVPNPAVTDQQPSDAGKIQIFTGKQLRRKKDILVASGGSRVRFSRKGGLLFVDRQHNVHSENCLWFEARRDHGTLDGFVAATDERARLFSAQFLKPSRYLQSKHHSELELIGRLGRGPIGWPCRIVIVGRTEAATLRLTIELATTVPGWRLRSRFLGMPESLVHHRCMPVREQVTTEHGGFIADTLVRSCATLMVDGEAVDVPGAASPQAIRHHYSLGNPNG